MSEQIQIVREPELPRINAATRAILVELTRLRPAGHWAPEYLAPMIATAAILADDEHGRELGLVVPADQLHWQELYALADLVAPGLDLQHHGGVGTWHPDCRACTAVTAYQRIVGHKRYRSVPPRPRTG
jgi:hypothetical protein